MEAPQSNDHSVQVLRKCQGTGQPVFPTDCSLGQPKKLRGFSPSRVSQNRRSGLDVCLIMPPPEERSGGRPQPERQTMPWRFALCRKFS